MTGLLSGETSHHGALEGTSHHGVPEGHHKASLDKPEEGAGQWYFSRKEIEENSPSRKDGIDLKKEAYLRKLYCTFLQDLGMRLKVPQVTIATAIIFCHRFFLRQSHAKNDRRTVAIVCMFLAGKVEETPRPLKDVILVSYEIIHKKDAAAVQRIKQKEVYEQQKELILLGERIVLVTLGFDLNVLHPYKPLVEAIKKFKVAQNALAQVAWNFVNDGLRTSLCLQFNPQHIAAGAIFLAAKFLKVKLPHEVWGQEFDVSPHQLEEVSNQMLELYEQNKTMPSQASEADGSAGNSARPQSKSHHPDDEHIAGSSHSGTAEKVKLEPRFDDDSNPVNHKARSDHGSSDIGMVPVKREKNDIKQEHEPINHHLNADGHEANDHKGGAGLPEIRNSVDVKDKHSSKALSTKAGAAVHQSPQSANKKLDLEKVISLKAAMERRKAQGDIAPKTDPEDEIQRELENVELPVQHEKSSRAGRKHTRSEDTHYNHVMKKSPHGGAEEGELESYDDSDRGHHSPRSSSRKRKSNSPSSDKNRGEYIHGHPNQSNNHAYGEDRNAMARHEYQDRENKRRLQENHV